MIDKIKKIISFISFQKNKIQYLRKQGMRVGRDCRIMNGYTDFGTEPYLISLGNHVSISAGTKFVTHEGAHWVLKGIDNEKYKDSFNYGRIIVKDNVFIGNNCIILKGVEIGENCIIGAGSVVTKSLEENGVYAGVPARRICSLEEWQRKFDSRQIEYDRDNYKRNKKEELLRIIK